MSLPRVSRAARFIAAIGLLALGGCAAPPHFVQASSSIPPTVVPGDWHDVDASVHVGASEVEMAIIGREELDPDAVLYTLVTVRDQPVSLRVERPRAAAHPDEMRMTCVVGRFGNAAAEQALIARVRQRLRDLSGKDYAPIR